MGKISALRCRGYSRLVVLLALVLALLFGISHVLTVMSYESTSEQKLTYEISLDAINQLTEPEELQKHLLDMSRLQKSVMGELSNLEQQRNNVKQQLEQLKALNVSAGHEYLSLLTSIKQMKTAILELEKQQSEALKYYRSVHPPQSLELSHTVVKTTSSRSNEPTSLCSMLNCFDFSSCSVLSGFPVKIYRSTTNNNQLIDALLLSPMAHMSKTVLPCLKIAVIEESKNLMQVRNSTDWNKDGLNHLFIFEFSTEKLPSVQLGKALVASSYFESDDFRPNYDFVLPFTYSNINLESLPLIVPALRPNLLVFHGSPQQKFAESRDSFLKALRLLDTDSNSAIDINLECQQSKCREHSEFCSCDGPSSHLSKSIFSLVIMPYGSHIDSEIARRLSESLLHGSIPVILGDNPTLPLDNHIPWSEACLIYPKPRITELGYILRNILEPDIVRLKRKGRLILESYLVDDQSLADAVLVSIRLRLGLPLAALHVADSELAYNELQPMKFIQTNLEPGEILGPVEDPYPSQLFQRNFTQGQLFQADGGHFLYPSTPWDPELPTDAKYHGSPYGFRPINKGIGGSGKEFSLSLGGNTPQEQFTVVILTYDRAEILLKILVQLKGLPYLNKVVVVWNNPEPPASNLVWPLLDAPIEVIKARKNSLNNRFYPYKEIETNAILTLDDDMFLQQHEIIFAFRVWRENRDRIVGFPGRYHAWNPDDLNWNYNSNHSCELSMILTGAAFFHKYYAYQYTFIMNEAIRDKVDDFMNCEDIAMNFLVSHITQQPPIKVTSRWTFRCPECGDATLWLDESHFSERHMCINHFIKIYGYMPLKYTQFRADSILFKTKVPSDKQKCFIHV